ncbi:hypothetical protein BGW38_008127, partial [Lunasporangiospora selenospora]
MSASHILHRGRSVLSKLNINKKYKVPTSSASPADFSDPAAVPTLASALDPGARSSHDSTAPTTTPSTASSDARPLGHLDAQGALAFCYEFGLGIAANFVQAESIYMLAAEKGNGLALSRLAFLRKYGRPSVKIDRIES